MSIEALLDALPDSLALSLVIFTVLYLLYLTALIILYPVISILGKRPFCMSKSLRLAILPFSAAIYVVSQLLPSILDALHATSSEASKKNATAAIDEQLSSEQEELHAQATDFNKAAVDPNYAIKHGLGGYNSTLWDD